MILMYRLALAWALFAGAISNAAAEDPLWIGLAAPLSGPDAVFGDQIRLGVDEAVTDLNASGGFLGRQAHVVASDDGDDAKKGVDVAKRFIASGINIIVGHFSSAVTVPASAVYANAGALDITPSAIAPIVTERGLTTVFRTCGREDQQADVAAKFLLDRHYIKIAIVHDRTAAGKGLADSVRASLAAQGMKEAYYGSFAQDAHDISGLVNRMRAAGTQIVVWGGGPAGAALLARQLRDAHIGLLGGTAMASEDFASLAGAAADGTFMVFPQDPRLRPAAADLMHRLQARHIDPYGDVFYAYAAVQVIQQAAANAKSLEPTALAAAIHSGVPFQTVIGPLAFDAKGDPTTSDLTVFVWHKGPSGRMGFSDPANS